MWGPPNRGSRVEATAKNSVSTRDLLARLDGRQFKTILADPPWRFQNKTGKVAPEHRRLSRYATLTLAEICALPVAALCAPTTHLYLWCPNALLPDGFAVMEAWRRSLVAVAPSVGPEAFGIAIMEAMSVGRPVIASRTGGLIDLVADGESGLLVEPGNASALQHAIKQLLADPGLRRRMGDAALHRVVEFQASSVVPRIEQVYERTLL